GLGQGECTKLGVGGTHQLSKRTNLYADYARLLDAERGSACATGINTYGGTHGAILGSDGQRNGYGEWGVNAGIRHTF
ncbi:MAG: hypothetical protein ACOYMX_00790, partial [Burkholderiales bacterium]